MSLHVTFALAFSLLCSLASAAPGADAIYVNAYIATIDAQDSVQQALAVQDGRIVYVGDNDGARRLAGSRSRIIDLQGRMLMPGLVDAHMHPQSGGSRLMNCSLDYAPLTVAQFQARIQACIDKQKADPKRWLVVVNWFQQGMQPEGAESKALLDSLKTDRPVVVRSSFGHSSLVNSKGMRLAGIGRATPDPQAGKIVRDAHGDASGLLEDAAQDMVAKLVPPLSVKENLTASQKALDAMRRQGITSFLDAYTDPETMTAFRNIQRTGGLTARAHFAILIEEEKGRLKPSVSALVKQARQFDQGETHVAPSMQVRHAKIFIDGVITAPAFTGLMLEPYYVDRGTQGQPHFVPGDSRGPAPYLSQASLQKLLLALAKAKIDPHLHVDGDGAVRMSLDAIEWLRSQPGGAEVRPALAHDEIVDPADYARFAKLNATAVLSFQWAKPAPDTLGALKPYMGAQRYELVEPQEVLRRAGARIAFGSDWPVDPLDQWFALKVAVTRTAAPQAGAEFAGRLTSQPGMPRAAALRAITLDAAYTLRQEKLVGSIEVGKLADFIVLDRNYFEIPEEEIAQVKVLQTVVGGKVVYDAEGRRAQ